MINHHDEMEADYAEKMRKSHEYWRIGVANEAPPEGKYFDEHEAIDKAARMADAQCFRAPIAVWNERGDIVHLFACGQQFRSV